jgi:hypothetical protein
MDRLEFLSRPDIKQAGACVSDGLFGFDRGDENPLVGFVGFQNTRDGFRRIDAVISQADAFQRFLGLETATGTTANMVMAKEGPLGAWALLQQLPHRGLWRNRHGAKG